MGTNGDLGIADSASGEAVTLGPLSTLVGYHLRRASNAFGADFARALTGTGMRQVLLAILSVVASNPRANQGSVGRVLGIQRANMVALINDLVERGLIDRQVAKGDRRAFALTITAEGRKLLDECLSRIAAHEAEMLSDLSEAERDTLIDLLGRIEAKER
ncbi:MarR family transcriptional regulator [Sphingomonas sp. AOB5]|uniref:MarR family winged helix-turn-helix transcriptional regulator n=1 Tax=Sphingomonas sp. AOB5 TaxID=3034017 RepID=UPI0023F82282|nr:MarR family transcriptional regulator [Sphingomonas sp. AOB5]MDF7776343.1 MarR family transcriptional regulator [Sphingomonas sp. AOB5]